MRSVSDITNLTTADVATIELVLVERDTGRDTAPAYIQVLTAIGGWIAASFLLGATGALTGMSLGYSVPGLIGVAAGLFVRQKKRSPFLQQMGAGMIVSGQLGFAIGLTAYISGAGVGVFALVAAAVAVLTLFVERRGLVGPTTVAVALAGLAAFLIQSNALALYRDMVFAAVAIGLALAALLVPHKGLRVEYCALWALIALIVFAQFSELNIFAAEAAIFGGDLSQPNLIQIWGGRAVVWLASLGLLYWSREHLRLYEVIGAGLLMTFCVISLSFMLCTSIFVLLCGYALGWRATSLCGVAAVVWSLSRYYYDMTLSLLDKSILLVVVGIALLGAAYFLNKAIKAEAQS